MAATNPTNSDVVPFPNAPAHFLTKLPSPLPSDQECWRWQGFIRANGYGEISWKGKTRLAHRVAYELHTGAPIPKDHDLDHVVTRGCKHRDCVNPHHLEAVDHAENMHRQGDAPPPQLTPWTSETAKIAAAKSAEVRAAKAQAKREEAERQAEEERRIVTVLATTPAHIPNAHIPEAKARILRKLLADEIPIRNAKEAADILQVLDAMERLDAGQPTSFAANLTGNVTDLREKLEQRAELQQSRVIAE